MINRSAFRLMAALAMALTSIGALAAPAAAETIIQGCSGTCGYYEYYDNEPPPSYGANCKYETSSYDLDFMSGKPPSVHGPYSFKTEVAYRIRILRSTNSGASWSTIHTSGWDTAMANDAIPAYAGNGFARIYWYANENPTGWFKMRVNLRWKNANGNVIGTAAAEYNSYKQLWSNTYDGDSDYCSEDYT